MKSLIWILILTIYIIFSALAIGYGLNILSDNPLSIHQNTITDQVDLELETLKNLTTTVIPVSHTPSRIKIVAVIFPVVIYTSIFSLFCIYALYLLSLRCFQCVRSLPSNTKINYSDSYYEII